MHAEITSELRKFVLDTFLLGQAAHLTDDSSFMEEGLIDSTGILELVSFIEERYAMQIADDELTPDNFDSINRVATFVSAKVATQSPHASA
jgi:acyl carrier protein